MYKIKFKEDGGVIISDIFSGGIILSPEEVQYIIDERELLDVIDDVKLKLTNSYEGSDDRDYDYDKFTEPVIRRIAKEVINRQYNSETNDNIVQCSIEDYEKGKYAI